MKINKVLKLFSNLSFCFALMSVGLHANENIEAELAFVKVSGSSVSDLKNREKLVSGHLSGLIFKASMDGVLYIVISDKDGYQLAHQQKVANAGTLTWTDHQVLKEKFNKYKNENLRLLVFFSPAEISEMNAFSNNPNLKRSAWQNSELALVSRGKSLKSGGIKKPASIAANMRSMNSNIKLKKYTGGNKQLSVVLTFYVRSQ